MIKDVGNFGYVSIYFDSLGYHYTDTVDAVRGYWVEEDYLERAGRIFKTLGTRWWNIGGLIVVKKTMSIEDVPFDNSNGGVVTAGYGARVKFTRLFTNKATLNTETGGVFDMSGGLTMLDTGVLQGNGQMELSGGG